MKFLIVLLIAHFSGDFLLQPNSWVNSKMRKGIISSGFWKHITIHIVLLFLIGLIYPMFWQGLIVVGLAHFIIDLIKIRFQKSKKSIWFFIDQFLHLLIIGCVLLYYFPQDNYIEFFWNEKVLIIMLGLILVTSPASILIKLLLAPYTQELQKKAIPSSKKMKRMYDRKSASYQSLKSGGKMIGMIERILVFIFILLGQWSAVGFLITAKSVFRFGDLNQGKNRQFTEYVLIGTLLSFAIAILIALITNAMTSQF